MNVYLVMEDGESRCFGAPSMAAAVEAAWFDALKDETERRGQPLTADEAEEERGEWEVSVLQSVTLVGELENFDDLRGVGMVKAPALDGDLVQRLRNVAADLYRGDSLETGRDPIACLLQAAAVLEEQRRGKEANKP